VEGEEAERIVQEENEMEQMDSEEALYWKRKKQLEDEQAEQAREKFVLLISHKSAHFINNHLQPRSTVRIRPRRGRRTHRMAAEHAAGNPLLKMSCISGA
jgi:hypothetical protein